MSDCSFQAWLLAHGQKYPNMQPRDAVKLAYQSEFGGGHMISDPQKSLAFLQRELAAVAPCACQLAEPIGGGKVRLHLAAFGALSPELVNRVFVASANRAGGTQTGLEEKISCIVALCTEGAFAFSVAELESYLADYRAQGCPAVSHSEIYRDTYHPAYRVIDARYVPLLPLMAAIEARLRRGERVSVAIDGMAASGKTTAAALIAEAFDGAVIHMDDFFLPPALRTPERLAEAGGNIDYDRFAAEVAEPLRNGMPVTYGVFDCSVMRVTHERAVEEKPLTIVEGSYSRHPRFGIYTDLTAFSCISAETQKERILARNGEAMWQRFRDAWIPMENRYFAAFDVAKTADFTVQTA